MLNLQMFLGSKVSVSVCINEFVLLSYNLKFSYATDVIYLLLFLIFVSYTP